MEAFLNIVVIALILPVAAFGKCRIPESFHGDWFSMESGRSVNTIITAERWNIKTDRSYDRSELICEELYVHSTQGSEEEGNNYVTMLMTENDGDSKRTCYYCVEVLWRTTNILQYRKGNCLSATPGMDIRLSDVCPSSSPNHQQPSNSETYTLFRKYPETKNCRDTFEGIYQFSYEENYGGGGICNNSNSQIKACQVPGSPYVDNQVFLMTYGSCPEVSTSQNKRIRYQCMGTWFVDVHGYKYKFAAVADTVEKDPRKRYKCLLTLEHQKGPNERWVMSRFSQCYNLNSIYNGPVRLVLSRNSSC